MKKQPSAQTAKVWPQFELLIGEIPILTGDHSPGPSNFKRSYMFHFSHEGLIEKLILPSEGRGLSHSCLCQSNNFLLLQTLGEILVQAQGWQDLPLSFTLRLYNKTFELKRFFDQSQMTCRPLEVEEDGRKFMKGLFLHQGPTKRVFINMDELGKFVRQIRDHRERWICLGDLHNLKAMLRLYRSFREAKHYRVMVAEPTTWTKTPDRFATVLQL